MSEWLEQVNWTWDFWGGQITETFLMYWLPMLAGALLTRGAMIAVSALARYHARSSASDGACDAGQGTSVRVRRQGDRQARRSTRASRTNA